MKTSLRGLGSLLETDLSHHSTPGDYQTRSRMVLFRAPRMIVSKAERHHRQAVRAICFGPEAELGTRLHNDCRS